MIYRVRTERRETTLADGAVWILESETSRAEIWPHQGFNCFRWHSDGREILYADPQFFHGSPPTRSGVPILFPFPNRIRDGRFAWEGREYQLPLNDPAGKNAIHGFTCRRPWRTVRDGADDGSAWVTGEFHAAIDGADCVALWPADYRLRVTYRLLADRLRIEAVVDNPATRPLPFGLGYHHYFQVESDSLVTVPARKYWELEETLPNGNRADVDVERDLRQPRRFADLRVDDVLTDLPGGTTLGLCPRGAVSRDGLAVSMLASAGFREVVVFTPPHRQAFCIEPYTCTTDAINLHGRGIDAGWRVLAAGESWTGVVDMRIGSS